MPGPQGLADNKSPASHPLNVASLYTQLAMAGLLSGVITKKARPAIALWLTRGNMPCDTTRLRTSPADATPEWDGDCGILATRRRL